MSLRRCLRSTARWLAAGVGLAAVGYATYVGVTWSRYGNPTRSRPEEQDELLDRFMPAFEVVERHRIDVHAPAAVTLAVAKDMKLLFDASRPSDFKGRD